MLTLSELLELRDIVRIIPLCLNLTSLMYWQTELYNCVVDPRNRKALRRLGCSFELFFSNPSDWQPSYFMQLTHLHLSSNSGRWYPALATLTNLSYLFVVLNPLMYHLPSIAQHLPVNLRVCVLCINQLWPETDVANIKPFASGEVDRRIVVSSVYDAGLSTQYVHRSMAEIHLEWTIYLRGPSFWEEAEAIVNQRSALKASCVISLRLF